MKRVLFVLTLFVISIDIIASIKSRPYEQPVILTGSTESHIIQTTAPTAGLVLNRNVVLTVNLDHRYFSSFTINLLSSDSSIDTTFVANSPTVNLPINAPTLDYVLTVDGNDYGIFDGVFNGNGNDSITLTDALALRLVKNRRDRNSTVNYFLSTVSSLINDSICCRIDALPSEMWATSQQEKCMIFIDENPQLTWGHECSYYYLPRQISSADSIKALHYTGILPPYGLTPTSVELNTYFSISDFQTPSAQFINALHDRNVINNHDAKYVIFGPPHLSFWDPAEVRLWNETSVMYTILVNKYNVSPDDIYVFMGNEDGTMVEYNGNGFDTIPMPKDLDGDLIDENIIPSTYDDVTGFFELLGDNATGHFSHLFIFYSGIHGEEYYNSEYDQYDMRLVFNESVNNSVILTSDLAEMIYRMDVDFVSSYFDPSIDGYLEFYLNKKHVVMGATGLYQSYVAHIAHQQYPDYNAFSYYWLSAAAETDLGTSQHINIDDNNDGIASFKELSYNAHNNFLYYCNLTPDSGYPINLSSSPQYLMDSLSLDHVPIHSLLKIDKYHNDSTVFWDSPDIWIRNQDDGVTHQESEHITLTEENPVYIYVRVHNEGDSVSSTFEKSVYLYAAPTAECYNYPMDFTQEYVGDSIGEFVIVSIPAGGSAIYCYEWYWDEPTIVGSIDWETLFYNSGNMIPIRIFALLGDETDLHHIQYFNHTHLIPEYKCTFKKHVAIEPLKGESFTEMGPVFPFFGKRCKFSIPLQCNSNGPYSIEVIADSTRSTSNLFSGRTRIALEPSQTILSALANGGSSTSMSSMYGYPNKYQVVADHASFSNLNLNGIVELTIYDEVNTIMIKERDEDWYFHIVLKDASGSIIDGQTVHSFVKGEPSYPITPFAIAKPTGNSNYILSETNICEPSRYEWYDIGLNKFDEGKTVFANKNDIGDIALLKVTSNSDDREYYALAMLDDTPMMAGASPVPFDGHINVTLTDNAVSGMSIRIVPVINTVNPIEQAIVEGSSNVVINTSSLPAGQYVLCLMYGNEVIQSLNIYKAN